MSINVNDIITMGWRELATGSREDLEDRSRALAEYISAWTPIIEADTELLSSAPLTSNFASQRIRIAFSRSKLYSANKAHRTINKEIARRGGIAHE